MGDHADDILNGDVDQYTGEWLGNGQGFSRSGECPPRGPRKPRKEIRKELAELIKEKKEACTTTKEENNAVMKARQEINTKYGKGWRGY